jgi:heterotetrameric sarcosine oxidase gamma subunit
VSAPESSREAQGCALSESAAQITELCALRGTAQTLATLVAARYAPLPACGEVSCDAAGLWLSTRPGRWLRVSPQATAAPVNKLALWREVAHSGGIAVDLSSAQVLYVLTGDESREVLARGCRLDLDRSVLPAYRAAATVMAQVSVTLVVLPEAMLLLTPASTARHFREWLESAARPFGLVPGPQLEQVLPGAPVMR